MAASKLDSAAEEVDRVIQEKLREGSPFSATAVVRDVALRRGVNARTLHRLSREWDGAIAVPNGHRKLSDMQELVLAGTVVTLARLNTAVRKSEIQDLAKSAFGVDVRRGWLSNFLGRFSGVLSTKKGKVVEQSRDAPERCDDAVYFCQVFDDLVTSCPVSEANVHNLEEISLAMDQDGTMRTTAVAASDRESGNIALTADTTTLTALL